MHINILKPLKKIEMPLTCFLVTYGLINIEYQDIHYWDYYDTFVLDLAR